MHILIGEELGGYLNYFNRFMQTIPARLFSRILLNHERVALFFRISLRGGIFPTSLPKATACFLPPHPRQPGGPIERQDHETRQEHQRRTSA